jgi:serine/threonine-protein kinase
LSLILHEGAAFLRVLSRDYEGALHGLRQLAEMEPSFDKAYNGMGRVLSLMGRYDEAIAMFEKADTTAGGVPYTFSGLGQNLALAGRTREALDCFAIVHLGLGQIDKSLEFLEASAEDREFPLVRLSVHPMYDQIRPEPRFQALLRRMNLLP